MKTKTIDNSPIALLKRQSKRAVNITVDGGQYIRVTVMIDQRRRHYEYLASPEHLEQLKATGWHPTPKLLANGFREVWSKDN